MLYIWLIALIFHRIMFLPLAPADLTPPYWINMGAMAISTLGGVSLASAAARMPLAGRVAPVPERDDADVLGDGDVVDAAAADARGAGGTG